MANPGDAAGVETAELEVSKHKITWHQMDLKSFVGSTAASVMVMETITYPLETVKTRMVSDTNRNASPSMMKMFRSIVQKEGVRGLFRGYTVGLTLSVPGSFAYLVTNEYVYDALEKRYGGDVKAHRSVLYHDLLLHGISGAVADFVATFAYTPLEVISQRMMVDRRTGADALRVRDVISSTIKSEGIGGLYRGFQAAFYCYAWSSGVYWGVYEAMKTVAFRAFGGRTQRNQNVEDRRWTAGRWFVENVLSYSSSGAVAALAATSLSNPLDLVRVRYQLLESGSKELQGGYWRFARTVVQKEGWRIWTLGLRPRLMGWIPFVSVSLPAYEWLKSYNKTSDD
ncbi:mitochondrial carrier domain-containing protein [Cladochytrium replicatum]|nr:mitochondrial carrier domain-containing protein [Cladochytrium replicatum]